MQLVQINFIRRIPVQLLFDCITSTAALNGKALSSLTANESNISQMKVKWPVLSTQEFKRLLIVMDPEPLLIGNIE